MYSEDWGQEEPSSGEDGTPKDDGVNKNPAESGEAKQSARKRRKKERQKAKKLAARGGEKEAEPTKGAESQQEVGMVLQRAIDMVVSSQPASQQVEGPQVGHKGPRVQVAAAGAPQGCNVQNGHALFREIFLDRELGFCKTKHPTEEWLEDRWGKWKEQLGLH